MRRVLLAIACILPLAACDRSSGTSQGVRAAYENHAASIDAQAARQPTAVARKIYHARADALREEGKDRQKGLDGGEPSGGQAAHAADGIGPEGAATPTNTAPVTASPTPSVR